MKHIWALHLYGLEDGRFKVLIRNVQDDRTVSGTGPTPQHAHRAAECQLVVKPWVQSTFEVTDDALRALWRSHGGEFWGPNVETVGMPEAKLLPFLRMLAQGSI